jgi:T5SS/PEP-CTERM-associated repeat protein
MTCRRHAKRHVRVRATVETRETTAASQKRLGAAAVVLVCWATIAPSTGSAQQALHIDNNETVTAAVGPTVLGAVVAGFNIGTVNGVPGRTYIVPAGADVTLSGLFAGFAAGSSGLVDVNGGTITTTNPQSQYYTGFNGSGTFIVSNGARSSAPLRVSSVTIWAVACSRSRARGRHTPTWASLLLETAVRDS